MSVSFDDIMDYLKTRPVINTHSHHREDNTFYNFNLSKLMKDSYIAWSGEDFDESYESKKAYLEKVRYKSYFVWLQKALMDIYKIEEPITPESWNTFSQSIEEAYSDNHAHIRILTEKCGYERIIMDAFWNPGSNISHPELFSPTFRINMFLFGYSRSASDHNGNNAQVIYNENIKDIDEYIAFIRRAIEEKKKSGCVALKSALAYDRGLDFSQVSREKAQKAFGNMGYVVTEEDIKAFQDYVFFEICKIAAELDLPLQNHTGLGSLRKTNALQMQEVIEKNPETKFVLFHGSYPWTDDIGGLLHKYTNVYPDLCWLPLISPTAAQRLLHEVIEIGLSDRVCWGCDTWTSEESYGALLAIRYVLASVLSEKIDNGYFSLDDAANVTDNILYNNAKKLYKL